MKLNKPPFEGLIFYDLMGNPIADVILLVENAPVYFTSMQDLEQTQRILRAMQ